MCKWPGTAAKLIFIAFIALTSGILYAQASPAPGAGDFVMNDHVPVEVIEVGPGHYFIDFGKAFFGTIVICSEEDIDDDIVLHIGEKRGKGNTVDRDPGGTIRYQEVVVDRLRAGQWTVAALTADSRNTGPAAIALPDTFPVIMPFRYCEIEDLPVPLNQLKIRQRAYHYRFNEEASHFSSSDTVLDQVWELCKHTIKATSFAGYYVDGDRERIPYEADAFINQLSHYCLDSVYTIARRTNSYFLENPTWPTEWILHVVPLFYYDYLYTGELDVLREEYDQLKTRTLMSLAREDGLISSASPVMTGELMQALGFRDTSMRIRDIVDWPPAQEDTGWKLATAEGERDGYEMVPVNTVVNTFYYWNLVLMSRIAGELGYDADQDMFNQKAGVVRQTINKVLFDFERGIYLDGEGSDHASLHANMFPLAFGLVPEPYLPHVIAHIKSRGMACSVYGAQYLLEGLCRNGESGYALQLITDTIGDRNWWNMIESGSTMTLEAWDMRYKPNLDWNHAWGTAPANIITRYLWGIRPSRPGFGRAVIAPQLEGLHHSRIRVPTAIGPIDAFFERTEAGDTYTFRLPEGMTATFSIPGNPKYAVLNDKKIPAGTGEVQLVAGYSQLVLIDPEK